MLLHVDGAYSFSLKEVGTSLVVEWLRTRLRTHLPMQGNMPTGRLSPCATTTEPIYSNECSECPQLIPDAVKQNKYFFKERSIRSIWRYFNLLLILLLSRLPWWFRWLRICLQCKRPGFNPWVRKIPWRREWLPTPVFLAGESHGQRSLVGYTPWGGKESNRTERLTFSLYLLSFHEQFCTHEFWICICISLGNVSRGRIMGT